MSLIGKLPQDISIGGPLPTITPEKEISDLSKKMNDLIAGLKVEAPQIQTLDALKRKYAGITDPVKALDELQKDLNNLALYTLGIDLKLTKNCDEVITFLKDKIATFQTVQDPTLKGRVKTLQDELNLATKYLITERELNVESVLNENRCEKPNDGEKPLLFVRRKIKNNLRQLGEMKATFETQKKLISILETRFTEAETQKILQNLKESCTQNIEKFSSLTKANEDFNKIFNDIDRKSEQLVQLKIDVKKKDILPTAAAAKNVEIATLEGEIAALSETLIEKKVAITSLQNSVNALNEKLCEIDLTTHTEKLLKVYDHANALITKLNTSDKNDVLEFLKEISKETKIFNYATDVNSDDGTLTNDPKAVLNFNMVAFKSGLETYLIAKATGTVPLLFKEILKQTDDEQPIKLTIAKKFIESKKCGTRLNETEREYGNKLEREKKTEHSITLLNIGNPLKGITNIKDYLLVQKKDSTTNLMRLQFIPKPKGFFGKVGHFFSKIFGNTKDNAVENFKMLQENFEKIKDSDWFDEKNGQVKEEFSTLEKLKELSQEYSKTIPDKPTISWSGKDILKTKYAHINRDLEHIESLVTRVGGIETRYGTLNEKQKKELLEKEITPLRQRIQSIQTPLQTAPKDSGLETLVKDTQARHKVIQERINSLMTPAVGAIAAPEAPIFRIQDKIQEVQSECEQISQALQDIPKLSADKALEKLAEAQGELITAELRLKDIESSEQSSKPFVEHLKKKIDELQKNLTLFMGAQANLLQAVQDKKKALTAVREELQKVQKRQDILGVPITVSTSIEDQITKTAGLTNEKITEWEKDTSALLTKTRTDISELQAAIQTKESEYSDKRNALLITEFTDIQASVRSLPEKLTAKKDLDALTELGQQNETRKKEITDLQTSIDARIKTLEKLMPFGIDTESLAGTIAKLTDSKKAITKESFKEIQALNEMAVEPIQKCLKVLIENTTNEFTQIQERQIALGLAPAIRESGFQDLGAGSDVDKILARVTQIKEEIPQIQKAIQDKQNDYLQKIRPVFNMPKELGLHAQVRAKLHMDSLEEAVKTLTKGELDDLVSITDKGFESLERSAVAIKEMAEKTKIEAPALFERAQRLPADLRAATAEQLQEISLLNQAFKSRDTLLSQLATLGVKPEHFAELSKYTALQPILEKITKGESVATSAVERLAQTAKALIAQGTALKEAQAAAKTLFSKSVPPTVQQKALAMLTDIADIKRLGSLGAIESLPLDELDRLLEASGTLVKKIKDTQEACSKLPSLEARFNGTVARAKDLIASKSSKLFFERIFPLAKPLLDELNSREFFIDKYQTPTLPSFQTVSELDNWLKNQKSLIDQYDKGLGSLTTVSEFLNKKCPSRLEESTTPLSDFRKLLTSREKWADDWNVIRLELGENGPKIRKEYDTFIEHVKQDSAEATPEVKKGFLREFFDRQQNLIKNKHLPEFAFAEYITQLQISGESLMHASEAYDAFKKEFTGLRSSASTKGATDEFANDFTTALGTHFKRMEALNSSLGILPRLDTAELTKLRDEFEKFIPKLTDARVAPEIQAKAKEILSESILRDSPRKVPDHLYVQKQKETLEKLKVLFSLT